MASKTLRVEVIGDVSSLNRALGKATTTTSKFGRAAKLALVGGVAAGLYAVGKAAKIGWDEYSQGAKVAAQTNAVLKSTGKVANVSAKHVEELGSQLMELSGIDDEVIKSGENVLLTFTKIRNEAGKGNDIFDQATKASLDLSVALGQDLQSSAIQVGKALNSPTVGLTALRRVGVSFSDAQVKLIQHLDETGHTLEAQKLVLRELNKEFGGSAKATGQTLPGKLAILREEFNNFAGDMVGRAIPAVSQFVDFLQKIAKAKGITAKLRVAFVGVRGMLQDLFEKLRVALFGGAAKPLKLPTGKILEWDQSSTQGLIDKLLPAVAQGNWTEVGKEIGRGIGEAIVFTANSLNSILTSLTEWVDAHSAMLGEVGAKIILEIINKLLDPGFWKQNWKLILSIAVAVFPYARFFKLGEVVGRVFGKAFGSTVGKLAKVMVDDVAKQLGRIPGLIRAAFKVSIVFAFVSAVEAAVRGLVNVLKALWGKLPGVVRSALKGIGGIILAAFGPVLDVIGWVRTLLDLISRIHIPSFGGGGSPGPGSAGNGRFPGGAAPRMTPRAGVTIHNHFPHYVGDKQELAAAVRDIVTKHARQNAGRLAF